MKRCTKCGETKPLTEFSRHKGRRDGRDSQCKKCKGEHERRHYKANREKKIEYQRRYYEANREEQLEKQRHRRETNPEKVLRSQLRRHNITPERYDELLEAQMGGCAICWMPPNGKRLEVDHDHQCCQGGKSCGKCIRGLLCGRCNTGLGCFSDIPGRLQTALDYVNKGPVVW